MSTGALGEPLLGALPDGGEGLDGKDEFKEAVFGGHSDVAFPSQLSEGDLAPLVQASIERRLGLMEGLYWGLTFSVTCAEDLPFITEEMIRQRTAGTYLGDYRIRQQHELMRSDLPVLLVSGERDPVTPPESAKEASRYMANRVHVVVKRGSHGGSSECVEGLIREFVERPLGKKLDASCAEKVYGPVVFMKP